MLRQRVRQELTEAGWMVTSKDAIKFGADFLLYKGDAAHSIMAVCVLEDGKLTGLDAQAFSRLCESVNKRALFVRRLEGQPDVLEYIEVSRWDPTIK
jgi:tRNA splicing endonuclease